MAKQFSTALSNFIATRGSINDALNNGVLVLFNGTQPSTADLGYNTSTASPLIAITEGSGIITKQVDPYFCVKLIQGGSDTVTSMTFAGIELLGATVSGATTALLATSLIDSINNNNKSPIKCYATANATGTSVVRIYLPKNTGDSMNANDALVITRSGSGITVAVNADAANTTWTANTMDSVAAITATTSYCVAGVDGANLLNMITSTAGSTAKESASWSGLAGTDKMNTALGTAGFTGFTSSTATVTWYRYYASLDDPELTGSSTADTSYAYLRYDGSIGTTSAYDMVASGGTTITWNATHTVPTFTFTVPATQA